MSEFSGQEFDFAAGSIMGLRGWGMDELGRLHGVTHAEVWRPGENASVCKATRTVPCPGPKPQDRLPKLSEAAVESKPKKKRRRGGQSADLSPYFKDEFTVVHYGIPRCDEPTCHSGAHTVPSDHRFDPDCQCGFWAYDEAGFKPHGVVIGVIEGYGKVTVGTKGFRAEKARIAALCENDAEGKRHSRSVLSRLATLYPDASWHADLDALIDAHGGVLRDWPEVGEDFWLRPVAQREGAWSMGGVTLSASTHIFQQQMARVSRSLYGGSI